jgi:mannose-6-phosphate isomerase-like protein (cupin superfamily)
LRRLASIISTIFNEVKRSWVEAYPGVFVSHLHRYSTGGGDAVFHFIKNASIPEHGHPTGEYGYVISGAGNFGIAYLHAGDAFWMEPGKTHNIRATQEMYFFATSLPRSGSDSTQ